MATRKIKKSHSGVTGVWHGTKVKTSQEFESLLERDLLILLDMIPSVAGYEVQPVTIRYDDSQSRERIYTPDVLVEFKRGRGFVDRRPWLVEVKPRENLRKNWGQLRERFRAAHQYARENGWRFRILTEQEIRTTALEHAKYFRSYLRREADPVIRASILESLRARGPCKVQEILASGISEPAIVAPTLWHLVSTWQVRIDLDRPLTPQADIWLPSPGEEDLSLIAIGNPRLRNKTNPWPVPAKEFRRAD